MSCMMQLLRCPPGERRWLTEQLGRRSVAGLLERLHTTAAGLTRALDAAAERDAWAADSPCEGWSAGDVADHIIGNYMSVAQRLGRDVPTTGDRLKDWTTARDAVL